MSENNNQMEKTMSEVNVPLLRKAVEWAEAEAAKPEEDCEWVQSTWVLPRPEGILESWGYNTPFDLDYLKSLRSNKSESCGTCFCIAGYVQYVTEGSVCADTACDAATEALGISSAWAEELFSGINKIEDVRRIAEQIAGERL